MQDKKFPLTVFELLFILKKGAGGTFFEAASGGRQCAASNSPFSVIEICVTYADGGRQSAASNAAFLIVAVG